MNKPNYKLYIFLTFYFMPTVSAQEIAHFKQTDSDVIIGLYQLMKDTHEICVSKNITYWIESGTLLGAVRHKGIIPWDTDLDIAIHIKDKKRMKNCSKKFRQLGYTFFSTFYGFAVKATTLKGNHIIMDINITENVDGKIWYKNKLAQSYWKREQLPIYFLESELFPLKVYQFGEVSVYGPQDPFPYLFAMYGSDCLEVGRLQISHNNGGVYTSEIVKLTHVHKRAASPTGPLLNRVHDIAQKL